MPESIEELQGKVLWCKECMQAKGLTMNIGKTMVVLEDWGSGLVLYVQRVLGAILRDVQDAVDGYTSDA